MKEKYRESRGERERERERERQRDREVQRQREGEKVPGKYNHENAVPEDE